MNTILPSLRSACVLMVMLSLLTGLAYPALVTGIGRLIFAQQAGGSLIVEQGVTRGSRLIGQPFDDPRYFWGRISATGPVPYNGGASSGANLAPSNPALEQRVRERILALQKADPGNLRRVPVDLVTASGSGLDPHISPAAAYYQAERVARLRAMEMAQVQAQIDRLTQRRALGVFGESVVNVLELNLALDQLQRQGPTAAK